MLFLAVSGALAVGVLAASTVGINNQRYLDAVNSFKSIVQEEFINTTRVTNFRQASEACPVDASDVAARGASDCIIMGRLMTVTQSGVITRTNLIGKGTVTPLKDIELIRSYDIGVDTASQQTSEMNWGTAVFRDGRPQAVSLVILRSPSNGNVLAFVKQGTAIETKPALKTFIDDNAQFKNNVSQTICVDPSGWTVAQMQGIVITPYAASPTGVEQRVVNGGSECV